MGLSYETVRAVPFGELLDLVAIEQIQNGVAVERADAESEFFELLNRR